MNMNGTRYIDQDTRDEIQRAKDSGKTDEYLAGKTGFRVPELCSLMGWPQWKTVPASEPHNGEFDLWSVEKLDGVL